MEDANIPTTPKLYCSWAAVLLAMAAGKPTTPTPGPEATGESQAEESSAEAPDSS